MKRKKEALRSGKRNSLLNFLKGCACIGVVFIHIPFPGLIGVVFQKSAQCAVPIFVMISGYFAYSVEGDVCPKVIRRAKRIGSITVCAIAMYLIYTIMIEIMRGGGTQNGLYNF